MNSFNGQLIKPLSGHVSKPLSGHVLKPVSVSLNIVFGFGTVFVYDLGLE